MSSVRQLASKKPRRAKPPTPPDDETRYKTSFQEQLIVKNIIRKKRLERILANLETKKNGQRVAELDGGLFDPQNIAEICELKPEWKKKMFVVRKSGARPQIVVGDLKHSPENGVFSVEIGDIHPARDLETFMYVFLGHFPAFVACDVKRDAPKKRNKRA